MLGKRVAHRLYAHVSLIARLPEDQRRCIHEAVEIAGLTAGEQFHVVRLDSQYQEVALLCYPGFFEELFPQLIASWRVHLPTRSVYLRDYSNSLNPPILHRKELMLPPEHPEQPRLQEISRLAESIGLFDDPVRIGFRSQWLQLVATKGYTISDQELVPIGNAIPSEEKGSGEGLSLDTPIARHLTALSRNYLSAPVQALLRLGLLRSGRSFLDYGCGKGDDIQALLSLGVEAAGWDPYFRPNELKSPADVVNLGYVINVIEDPVERITVLEDAYSLTKGVMSVSAMLCSANTVKGRRFRDGYLTARNTFQRYYTQSELQGFIESVLEEQASPVGPGLFLVFRDRYLEQQFYSSRQADPTRVPRLLATRRERPVLKRIGDNDPRRLAVARSIVGRTLEMGRMPAEDEFTDAEDAVKLFGSWQKATRAAKRHIDQDLLRRAANARTDELRAFFAFQAFGRRKSLRDLDPGLRRDVQAFFGSLKVAESEGRRLLYKCADIETIRSACERAAAQGLGWLERGTSLQLHTSLVPRLDPVLRVYVQCGAALYGDISTADLVKIHIESAKITLMKFDDFAGTPLPRLLERTKVKLREQDMEYFEYGGTYEPPYLYYKSRYINEEFPNFAEQQEFDRELEVLGLGLDNGYGPEPVAFREWLARLRREIDGFRLVRSFRIPTLDEPCGKHFKFRDLIECGETWERSRVDNTPLSPQTYNALVDLATYVLDPVIDYFGRIKLTYGFASARLTQNIKGGISPKLDQHSSCETNSRGAPVCTRLGAAADFLVEYEDMFEVAKWISEHCDFDRIYIYGRSRPIHVSVGPQRSREVFEMRQHGSRRIPRRLKAHFV